MTVSFRRALAFVLSIFAYCLFVSHRLRPFAQDKPQADKRGTEKLPSIAEKTKGLQKIDGYMPLYWQAATGKLFMEIGRFNQEMLYQVSLPAGLGSNPVGLDRGQLGDSSVVTFERIGPKVLMTQPNYRYRAITHERSGAARGATTRSRSRCSGASRSKPKKAAACSSTPPPSSCATRTAWSSGCARRSRGSYKLDDSRSALYLPRTKGFPKNTEIETTLTFTTDDDPGRYVRETTPSPAAVTLREHHSFVELPDLNYKPRKLDPRAPSFGIEFYDYASPINEPVEKRWISRHRLEKKDPAAAVSEPVKPIVYYVDNGAPEPIRTALIEGASWWNQAFEAAGFRNAFQVKVLPADADPMDVRYNMINWVHRSTRGWSYGGGIIDPRTGEIIKGNVTLGSLRVRQDFTHRRRPDSAVRGGQSPASPTCRRSPITSPRSIRRPTRRRCRWRASASSPRTRPATRSASRHNFAASTLRPRVGDGLSGAVGGDQGRQAGSVERLRDRHRRVRQVRGEVTPTRSSPPGANEAPELEQILEDGVAHGMLYITRLRCASGQLRASAGEPVGQRRRSDRDARSTRWRCAGSACRSSA